MKYHEVSVPHKEAWIAALGDLHVGDPNFDDGGRQLLEKYLAWLKRTPNAVAFLNGDILNAASRVSRTSPFGSRSGCDEIQLAKELLEPVAKKIIGMTDGNHENRYIDMFGMSPLQSICSELGIKYFGWSCVVGMNVGDKRAKQNKYYLYFHHTTGGGYTTGAAINRVTKLQDIVEGIDVYFGSHNHKQITSGEAVYCVVNGQIEQRSVHFVDCGSFVSWNHSYAEQKQLKPTLIGSPIVKLGGGLKPKSVQIINGDGVTDFF